MGTDAKLKKLQQPFVFVDYWKESGQTRRAGDTVWLSDSTAWWGAGGRVKDEW